LLRGPVLLRGLVLLRGWFGCLLNLG
jgi:hypothetical protein